MVILSQSPNLRSPGIASQPGGIDSLTSTPGLLKRLQIWDLAGQYDIPIAIRFLAPTYCSKIPAQAPELYERSLKKHVRTFFFNVRGYLNKQHCTGIRNTSAGIFKQSMGARNRVGI
jgi:hypothetical protein